VAVALHRSVALVVAVLGIQKAGGAFVALDPTHPAERTQFILEDCGAAYGVSMEGVFKNGLPCESVTLIDVQGQCVALDVPQPPAPVAQAHNLCYTYYTSGSTGKPKGVMVEHRNVVNQLFHFQREFPLGAGRVVMAVTTLTFDPCICEIFWPLAFGAQILVVSSVTQRHPDKMIGLLEGASPHILQATPTMFQMLAHMGWNGAADLNVLSGGEAFPSGLSAVMRRCRSFSNVYGPTETTVWATQYTVRSEAEWVALGDRMPAGRGLQNYLTLVLDASMQPVAQGEMGELYLGGAGMTRGYHNRDELNAKAFVQSPFQSLTDPMLKARAPRCDLLYRTGDLFMWTPEGQLMYAGRADSQVKVNGHRMELGEIEHTLQAHPKVERAIVLVRTDLPGRLEVKTLVCYVQCTAGGGLPNDEIKEFLTQQLPYYMVPTYYVHMEEWPLNPSNKVMRQALPLPAACPLAPPTAPAAQVAIDVGPSQSLEDVVGVVVQVAQNFTSVTMTAESSLLEVGIDSFASVNFAKGLQEALGVAVTGRDLLKYPRVNELARYLHMALQAERQQDALSSEMQLMRDMEPLTGLRGLVILQVFWYHFHWTWPIKLWPLFGRCMDMEIFFCIMGLTTMVQHRNHYFSSISDVTDWWWSQWWKIFPMYWLALGLTALSPKFNEINTPLFTQPDVTGHIGNSTVVVWSVEIAYSQLYMAGETLLNIGALQTVTDDSISQLWFNLVFWFVGTMWVIFALFPLFMPLVRRLAPPTNRWVTATSLLAFLVIYWVLWLGCNIYWVGPQPYNEESGESGFFMQATPWVKIWVFVAGMFVGQLLLSEAQRKDEGGESRLLERLSPRSWGVVSDVSGLVLGFLTFGPPYYDRDYKDPESGMAANAVWGYFHTVEQYVIMPGQLIAMVVFLYALMHNRGLIAAALNFSPVRKFGTVVYPFYLFHWMVTSFTLSGTMDVTNEGHFSYSVDNTNIGMILPLGGVALTFIIAYLVNEYYQPAVMRYIEPAMAWLFRMDRLVAGVHTCRQRCKVTRQGAHKTLIGDVKSDDRMEALLSETDSDYSHNSFNNSENNNGR